MNMLKERRFGPGNNEFLKEIGTNQFMLVIRSSMAIQRYAKNHEMICVALLGLFPD